MGHGARHGHVERYPEPPTAAQSSSAIVPWGKRNNKENDKSKEKFVKRMTLTIEELREAIPDHLQHLIESCDVDGCGTNHAGIPLCLTYADRNALFPYIRGALEKINKRE